MTRERVRYTGHSIEWTSYGNPASFGPHCHEFIANAKSPDGKMVSTKIFIELGMGLTPPDSRKNGVTGVIPDIAGELESAEAIFLSHAHTDHDGGLPHMVMECLNHDIKLPPIYGHPLSIMYAQYKMKKLGLKDQIVSNLKFIPIYPNKPVRIGAAAIVQAVPIPHSHACAYGYYIRVPMGEGQHRPAASLFYSGDAKVDLDPLVPSKFDMELMQSIQKMGVDFLFLDSTYGDRPGPTQPERAITEALVQRAEQYKSQRLVAVTMTQNHQRLANLFLMAEKTNRKVVVTSKSIMVSLKFLQSVGINFGQHRAIDATQEYPDLPPHEVLLLATGSQGEPHSGMYNAVLAPDHSVFELNPNTDAVLLCASVVPGNEDAHEKVFGPVAEMGIPVHREHVSGHLGQGNFPFFYDNLRSLTEPSRFTVVPIHGTDNKISAHADYARTLGYNVLEVHEAGLRYELAQGKANYLEEIPVSYLGYCDSGNSASTYVQNVDESGNRLWEQTFRPPARRFGT